MTQSLKNILFAFVCIVLLTTVRMCGQSPKVATPAKTVETTHEQYVKVDTTHEHYVKVDTTHEHYVKVDTTHEHYVKVDTTHEQYVKVDTTHEQYVKVDTTHEQYVKVDTTHEQYVKVDTTHEQYVKVDTTHEQYVKVDTAAIANIDTMSKMRGKVVSPTAPASSSIKYRLGGSVGLAYSPDSLNRNLGPVGFGISGKKAAFGCAFTQSRFIMQELSFKIDQRVSVGLKDSTAQWSSPARDALMGDYRMSLTLSREGIMGSLPDSLAKDIKGVDMRQIVISASQINYHRSFKGGGLEVSLHPLTQAARLGVRLNKGLFVAGLGVTALLQTSTFNVKGNLGVVKKTWSLYNLNEAIILSGKGVTGRSILHVAYSPTPKIKAQAWGCVQYGSGLLPSYSAGGDVCFGLGKGCDAYVGALYRSDINQVFFGAPFMSKGKKYGLYTGIKIAFKN